MNCDNTTRQKILLVEDNAEILKLFSTFLSVNGYSVIEAHNGSEGLNILNSEEIDLVISDWKMPVMSGMTLLKNIRNSEPLKDLPVLLVSATDTPSVVNAAYSLGVADWLRKPLTFQKLLSAVDRAVKNS